MSDDPYEPDRVEGLPHPRHTRELIGHGAAEAAFLDAMRDGRLHHAWLVTGPRGVGKATLAWRIARRLIAPPQGGADGLDPANGHPALARIDALSEPRVFLMRPTRNPDTGTPRRQITVDVARRLKGFLGLSAADGGWRVVIVDAADDLNAQSANAMLKLLEEPPKRTVFLLVCHAPARLLPTIRSRCRTLRLPPLGGGDIARALDLAGVPAPTDAAALAELSGGSVGEAARLVQQDGPSLYADLVRLLSSCPDIDRAGLIALGDGLFGAQNAARLEVLVRLLSLLLSRLARAGAGRMPQSQAAEGEAALLSRLAPDLRAAKAWADAQGTVSARLSRGLSVNLDPSTLILDTGLTINETGRAVLGGR